MNLIVATYFPTGVINVSSDFFHLNLKISYINAIVFANNIYFDLCSNFLPLTGNGISFEDSELIHLVVKQIVQKLALSEHFIASKVVISM